MRWEERRWDEKRGPGPGQNWGRDPLRSPIHLLAFPRLEALRTGWEWDDSFRVRLQLRLVALWLN